MLPTVGMCYNSSEHCLDEELYIPCLEWATKFDRGVGYFTSSWLSHTAKGMASFAQRGGRARWLTSPILDERDYHMIRSNSTDEEILLHFRQAILDQIDTLATEIQENTLNALAWMIFDGIIVLRFAVPTQKLDGDFHDKFGIFSDGEGNRISFNGSINDSAKGFSNYESIKVFRTWDSTASYVENDAQRFERIWNGRDPNLRVFSTDRAIQEKIFRLRTSERPYNQLPDDKTDPRWKHQDEAMSIFLERHNGILEMATGTGKTRTALKIIHRLFDTDTISRVVISMYGNDLLKQWVKECFNDFGVDIQIYQHFESNKDLQRFLLCRKKCILIISRDAGYLSECLMKLETRIPTRRDSILFVFDEVHGFGASSFRCELTGKIAPYKYRLGLSATPEREYDDLGNKFIRNEIGPVIYTFGLEDAIRNGILCEFDYFPLNYSLSDDDKRKKQAIIASFSARRTRGEAVRDEDMYQQLAMVNKLSPSKLPLFHDFIAQHPNILERCLIFVETKEYGTAVQQILIEHCRDYHTYYGEDDEENLHQFARGRLNCLVTCKKISEGIDIKTVKNIILFSSDRSRLVTIQRIGRSLRIDPSNPSKRAGVVDFIVQSDSPEDINADTERRNWLSKLAQVRRENV